MNFTRHGNPVLYADNDPWKEYEWEGGCEDLHIVEGEDGTYYMNYTTWSGKRVRANFLLKSTNLAQWEYLHPFVEDDQFSLIGDDGACPHFWPIGGPPAPL